MTHSCLQSLYHLSPPVLGTRRCMWFQGASGGTTWLQFSPGGPRLHHLKWLQVVQSGPGQPIWSQSISADSKLMQLKWPQVFYQSQVVQRGPCGPLWHEAISGCTPWRGPRWPKKIPGCHKCHQVLSGGPKVRQLKWSQVVLSSVRLPDIAPHDPRWHKEVSDCTT